MKIMEIEGFSLTVYADKELLTPQFKQHLNPMEIEIIGAKELLGGLLIGDPKQ